MTKSILFICLVLLCTTTRVGGFAPLGCDGVTPRTTASPLDVIVLDPAAAATPLELWIVARLEDWYSQSITIKCPFIRRRTGDVLDALDMVMRFLVIRHKSLDILPPLGCRPGKTATLLEKSKHLGLEQIADIIRTDWCEHNDKGYYITARLNTTVYCDDCLFDGPDPDMPVRGLRKYLTAASQLFDRVHSTAQLLSLKTHHDENTIVAKWRLKGVLRLPWRPQVPVWTGTTTYHLDEDNLIFLHQESWDISVLEAFVKTLSPELGSRIWDEKR